MVMRLLIVIIIGVLAGIGLNTVLERFFPNNDDQIAEDQLIKMVIGSWQVGYEQSSVACKCFDYEKFQADSINYSNEINKILK
jgi:hypothetical protein